MPQNHLSMRAAIISLCLYKSGYFLFEILSNYTLKHIDCNMFSKQISGANELPHNKRVAITIFYIKNDKFLRQI